MPGAGYGTDTLKRLREIPQFALVPVIFMTGMDLNKARALLPAEDKNVWLVTKPLDLDRLRDYVWEYAGIAVPAKPEAKPQ